MPGPLKRPDPFRRKRRGRGLPGQSSPDDLEVGITFKVTEGAAATIINEELIQIGNMSAGRYVEIDATGMKLFIDETGTVQIQFYDGQDLIGKLYGLVDSGNSAMFFYSQGKDTTDREASVTMQAITDDGLAHAGAASVKVEALTQYDRIALSATYVNLTGALRLGHFTTAQRNALSAVNGMLLYNSTTNKIQGYEAGAWVDLH